MPRKKVEKALGPDGQPLSSIRKGRWNWLRAEKICAVHAALAASEYGLTTAGGVDGPPSLATDDKFLKALEDSLHKRCEVEYAKLATGHLAHLFRVEKHSAEDSAALRSTAGGGAAIWQRWVDTKKEITGRIFECVSEFVDANGVPLSGTQWTLVVEKVRRAYWRVLQLEKMDDKAKKLTKKRKQMEIAGAAHEGSSADEEDVGDINTIGKEGGSDIPPLPDSWNPVAYSVFVTHGPPALEKCIPALAWKAQGRGNPDCAPDVEEVEPLQVSRGQSTEGIESTSDHLGSTKKPAQNRLEMRKRKREYDKQQKNAAAKSPQSSGAGHGPDGAKNLDTPFTPGTKAVLGAMKEVRQQFQQLNYQNSMVSLFQMEDDPVAKAAIRAELLQYKNSMRGCMMSDTVAAHTGGEAIPTTAAGQIGTTAASPTNTDIAVVGDTSSQMHEPLNSNSEAGGVGGIADEQHDPSPSNNNTGSDNSDLDL